MRKRVTTICCSALALTLPLSGTFAAQKAVPALGLFPVATRWSKTLDANLSASPGFDEGRVFLPLEDGRLVAYDLLTGREVWSLQRDAVPAPVAADGHVFLATGTSLVAVAAASGQVAWESTLDSPLSAPVSADEGWIFVAGASGVVTALRTADGSRVWSRDVASPPVHAASIAATHVYVPVRDGRIVALNIESGTVAWERRIGGTPEPVLALGDRLYVGSDDNYFYCLHAETGRVEWRWQTGGDIVGKAAFDGDRVYFVSKDNVLRALDRRSGGQRWKKPLPLRATSGPLVVRDSVLVSGMGPAVQGFHMRDGAAAGDFDVGGLLAAPPHAVPDAALAVPIVAYVTRSLTSGPILAAVARNVEPAVVPVAPLPNPIPVQPLPAPAGGESGGTPPSSGRGDR